ncbi:MAG: helix-turn-helix domain-containing protein [Candidatus Pacebacteria bacterium]|nr:helix-turn-helix domain-containing protein [Candidatus Paceibacterota bacterium]
MDEKLISIGEAAEILKVSVNTLRRWDESGKLRAVRKSPDGNRFYREIDLTFFPNTLYEIAFKWASSSTGNVSGIPPRIYSENSAVFQTRLGKFQTELQETPGLEEIFPLVVSICGEIGGNSFDHNIGQWPDVSGILFLYDIPNKEVILADRGQGILTTLKKAVLNLVSHEEAISIAFTEIISGRTKESRGNGLKYVRSVVAANPISLRFQSGAAQLEIKHNSSDLNITNAIQYVRGCIAFIKF